MKEEAPFDVVYWSTGGLFTRNGTYAHTDAAAALRFSHDHRPVN